MTIGRSTTFSFARVRTRADARPGSSTSVLSEASDDPDARRRRHSWLLRGTRRTDPRLGAHRSDGALLRGPRHAPPGRPRSLVQRQPRARRMALPRLRRQRRSVRRSQGPGLLRPRSNRPDGRPPAYRVPPTPASQRQGSTDSRVDLHASGHVSARAAARDRGRHRPLAGRTRSRHRPHRQAQPWPGLAVRHDARARARSRPRTRHHPGSRRRVPARRRSCATSRGPSRASRRCSRPRAHAERCCRTPPPNRPRTCCSWRASRT